MTEKGKLTTVAIIGGGPVGSVAAIQFAQKGWKVDLFEQRSDIRLPENQAGQRGRSINLSLSERGLRTLRKVGLENSILSSAVPTHSRMIHEGKEGKLNSQSYSVYGDHTNSIDRHHLNISVLQAAEQCPNVTIYFEHKLDRIDFESGWMEFLQGPDKIIVNSHADLIIGADGAYSKVRAQMMRTIRMNYQQEYINTSYCELHMPAKIVDGKRTYAMDPNHLHIWPRQDFLITAIPDKDHTFTCTLFMPFNMFDSIDDKKKLMNFFTRYFKDIIPLIGETRLEEDYFQNPRGSLISIKVSPYHVDNKAILVGDAAHAMVPFYGQGLNCGLQDLEVFFRILDQSSGGLGHALAAYSAERVKDCHAMCDLAMYNYKELSTDVTSPIYLIRRRVERWIHARAPSLITPLYCMVSFSTMPYSKVMQRWHRQTLGVTIVLSSLTVILISIVLWCTSQTFSPPHSSIDPV
ncbi:kynurenine 3-monooxygenase-like protein [Chlamydoabsidia padenii]|nr:kynurenine 3-monooxygenase-like protein [Chlamydoabsidia padenii]